MTSPPLKAKPRTEPEARFDSDHARHRRELTEISYFLQARGAPERMLETLAEVHDRLIDQAAKELVERAKK